MSEEDTTFEANYVDQDLFFGCQFIFNDDVRVIFPNRDDWLPVAEMLFIDGWNMCVDVTAVDYLNNPHPALPNSIVSERFEVVANFISHQKRKRLRARIQVPESDPSIASLYEFFPGTDYLEREVYDMFGIEFTGHPDLSRILMPESWVGHPLRKDFSTGVIPVQFKSSRENRK